MLALNSGGLSALACQEVSSFSKMCLMPAGGYDAVYILAVDEASVVSGVEDVWSSWTEMSVCPLSARQSDGGLLRVNHASQVDGLEDALERAWNSSHA